MELAAVLAKEFNTDLRIVQNIVALIDEGNTIPFIARYRKEMTGAMDDQVLRELSERLTALRNLEKRKEEVLGSIEEQGKLTDALREAVTAAKTLSEIEDIYRPYKQKRRTRAMVAREQGLEPLAEILRAQNLKEGSVEELAAAYVEEERGVSDVEAALAGAMDIIAEDLSDDAELRKTLRAQLLSKAALASSAAKEEDSVYRLYYEFSEAVRSIPSHRILAINRGEKEEFLKVRIETDVDAALHTMEAHAITGESITTEWVRRAAHDAWKRLIFPSLERELRGELTERANTQAIRMFGQNLKPTLMQPPLHGKVVLGFDPAYRTGCKLAVVDATGKALATSVIYPTPPHSKVAEAKKVMIGLIRAHGVEVIAIGNGTASKESEIFVSETLKEIPEKVSYAIVNEAGASVYSASKLGAQEFPDFDVSLRSAVSIARRLQDPMAELVKIDPKAIGVGQYQHDMPVKQLDEALTGVVEDCVNSVGVNINTASASLLAHVAGLSAATAKNICEYREANGAFTSRSQIKKVPRLGPKAYEQCAGFLRIPGGKQILDNTAVHPESYKAAKQVLERFEYSAGDIQAGKVANLPKQVAEAGEARIAEACEIGVPTLRDMIAELVKPGRDIRDSLPQPLLRDDVMEIGDLKPGMEFMGTVRNVIDFGAFVDIGVHQDGLVHISKMADRFIRHPSEAAKVGDIVKVWVISVDVEKKRIALRMVEEK